jgi:putative cardiolipin synthase
MTHGTAIFLQDEPVNRGNQEFRLYDMINLIVEPGSREMIISTPYLIPVGDFLDVVEEDVANGVNVSVLTNSLASVDHTVVNSHYKKYRDRILDTGVSLYEFHHKPSDSYVNLAEIDPQGDTFVGLHAKASVIDGQRCFIGSLNLDPRAVVLNTENGLYIESPEFCGDLEMFLKASISPENAWHVGRDEKGNKTWTSYEGVVDSQPARSGGQRVSDFFFRMLPVGGQL